jgi:hypothetical protein
MKLSIQNSLLIGASLVALAGCVTTPTRQYSNEEILGMTKQGKTGLEIVDTLRAGRAVYDKPASELLTLGKSGVAAEVLDYMQQTQLDEIRRDERWRAYPYGDPFYRPWRSLYRGPHDYPRYVRPKVSEAPQTSVGAQ